MYLSKKLAGGAIEEIGLLFADKVRVRRLKNQLNTLEKAKKIAADANIDIKQISLKNLVPLLEYSSLEEDEDLQKKWANLLVNYADSSKQYQSSVFPYILSQLSPDECRLLERIYYSKDKLVFIEPDIVANNLIRLGVIEKSQSNNHMLPSLGIYPPFHVSITDLGKQFVECCNLIS